MLWGSFCQCLNPLFIYLPNLSRIGKHHMHYMGGGILGLPNGLNPIKEIDLGGPDIRLSFVNKLIATITTSIDAVPCSNQS